SKHEAGALRQREAETACDMLQATAVFAGQIDGQTFVSQEWINKFARFLYHERPDMVFTHWPLDVHADHQVASILTLQASLKLRHPPSIYFYEVCSSTRKQTYLFEPTEFVDIADVTEQKRQLLLRHASQDPERIYDTERTFVDTVRGRAIESS